MYYIIIILCLSKSVFSQTNLVPNPNFDERKPGVDCSYSYTAGLLEEFIEDWHALYESASVRFYDCIGITYDTLSSTPKVGNGMILMITDLFPGINQCCQNSYMQVKLLDTLKPDKKYFLEYHVQIHAAGFAIPYFGIQFLDTLEINGRRGMPFAPPIIHNPPHLEADTAVGLHDRWTPIQHCFTVDQDYHVLSAGIFRHRDSINAYKPDDYTDTKAYYNYDAFYLIEVEDSLTLKIEEGVDTICVGECLSLSTNHSRIPGEFVWQLPGADQEESRDSVAQACYSEPGIYDVGITVDHCHGLYEDYWTQRIVVLDKPVVSEDNIQQFSILEGTSIDLDPCLDGDWSIRWEGSSGLSCTDCRQSTYSGDVSAEIQAIIAPKSPCPDTCFYQINIVPRAQAQFRGNPYEVCLGDCYRITNTSQEYNGEVSYLLNGELFIWDESSPSEINICPDKEGVYELWLFVENELSRDSSRLQFEVIPFPELITTDTDFTVEHGEEILVQSGFQAENYLWTADSHSHLLIDCPSCFETLITGLFSSEITLTASNSGCSSTMRYNIDVLRQEPELYIPNSFTPNSDGINDVFRAEGRYFTTLSLKIYDRFGNLIYEDTGADAFWDGTRNGEALQTGTYVYTIEYEDIYGDQYRQSGDITLIR